MGVKQKGKSLSVRGSELSDSFIQLEVLNGKKMTEASFPSFAGKLGDLGFKTLKPATLEIFQLNIGKLCNQTCAHCHVDAGPDKGRQWRQRPRTR